MINNVEEDMIMLSGSGEIKLGGNGITTTGIKINNNTNIFPRICEMNEMGQRVPEGLSGWDNFIT